MRTENCKNCRAFHPTVAGAGECRKNPPGSLPMQQASPLNPREVQLMIRSFWPPVAPTEWCDQFQPVQSEARSVAGCRHD
jgi:hypothetical protein